MIEIENQKYQALHAAYKKLLIHSAKQQDIIDEQFNTIQSYKAVDNSKKRIPFKL